LREHVLRVREVALVLAGRYRVDREKVWLAASAHDIAREMDGAGLLVKARELGISLGPLEEAAPVFLHGPIAAELLRRQGVTDTEVYQAIYWHSTARTGMTVVEKVLFLADKLDPEKIARYPYLPLIKALAGEDLDRAILEFLNRDLAQRMCQGDPIHPASLEARNELLLKSL